MLRLALRGKNKRLIIQNQDDQKVLEDLKVVSDAKIALIRGSGVDIDRFKRIDATVCREPVVMFVARLLRDKGIGEFIEAAKLLASRGHQCKFIVVGDRDPQNPECISLKEQDQWRNERNVEFWGRIEDMPSAYEKASIVCLPSYREGLPKALLEAASMKLPLVAFDVPGCREIVIHEKNGLLVPLKNVNELANALENLLLAPEKTKQMGEKGREMVELYYSEEVICNLTKSVWETIEE